MANSEQRCRCCCWSLGGDGRERRTTLERLLLAVALLALAAAVVALVCRIYLVSCPAPNTSQFNVVPPDRETMLEASEICTSGDCVKLAHQMMSIMNTRVHPCDDFFSYACGNWPSGGKQDNSVPQQLEQDIKIQFKNMLEADSLDMGIIGTQFRTFYTSCMDDVSNFQTARNVLDGIGRIIMDRDEHVVGITRTLTAILRVGGTAFFDVGLHPRQHDATQLIITISLPSISGIPVSFHNPTQDGENNHNEDEDSHIQQYNQLKANVDGRMRSQMLTVLLNYFTDSKAEQVEEIENELNQFLVELTKIMPSPKQLNQAENDAVDVEMTIKDVQKLYHLVEWKQLLSELFNDTVEDDMLVEVSFPTYMQDLNNLLNNYTLREINNVAIAVFARDVLLDLISQDADRSERWKYCVGSTISHLPIAASLFLKKYYSKIHSTPFVQLFSTQLFNQMKNTLISRINTTNWMSANSKSTIIDKVRQMRANFGEISFTTEDPVVKELKMVQLNESLFVNNAIILSMKNREMERDFYRQKLTKDEIEKYFTVAKPYTVNAFYVKNFNKIIINLGLFTPPFFISSAPYYYLYATFGSIIAHEMYHAFGSTGIKYDALGNKLKVRIEDGMFENFTKEFNAWYNTTVPQLLKRLPNKLQFDARYTSEENFADSSIDVAFQTYKTWAKDSKAEKILPGLDLTIDELFFLSVVQSSCSVSSSFSYVLQLALEEHLLDAERVNSYLMNSPEFAKAFRCSQSSPMNPPHKVTL